MKEKDLKVSILRIGKKYVQAPIPLKITIGEILEGKVRLNYERNIKK